MCPSLRGRSIAKPMGYRTLCNSICSVCPVKIPVRDPREVLAAKNNWLLMKDFADGIRLARARFALGPVPSVLVCFDTPLSANYTWQLLNSGSSKWAAHYFEEAGFPAARQNAYSDEKREMRLTNRTNTQ